MIFQKTYLTAYAVIDLRYCTFTIKDGAPTSVTLKIGTGNFTWSETRNIEYRRDRGKISTGEVRELDEDPISVNFTFEYEYYTIGSDAGSVTITPADIIKGVGCTTAGADSCEPYACVIEIEYNPNCDGAYSEKLVFAEFRYEDLSFDLDAGTISCRGMATSVTGTSLGAETNT